jgi:hypothetical protein
MKAKTKALLTTMGATKIKFYEINSAQIPFLGPVLTVCLLLNEENFLLSRGVSIKSVMDSYNKKEGKDRAFRRALTALFKKSTNLPINVGRKDWKKYCKKIVKVRSHDDIVLVEKCEHELRDIYGFNDIPKFEIIRTTVYKNGTEKRIAKIYLPKLLPLTLALYHGFTFKSAYEPLLTRLEKNLLETPVNKT